MSTSSTTSLELDEIWVSPRESLNSPPKNEGIQAEGHISTTGANDEARDSHISAGLGHGGDEDPSIAHPRPFLSGAVPLAGATAETTGAKPDSEPTVNSKAAPRLTGWAALQDRLYTYDSGLMKNYSEDIDTLLVFAGLFSAVLTAFVVPAYQLLQPDNSDLSLKALLHISAQLGSSMISETFVNSTVAPLPTTPSSAVPALAVARALNILWFLSLVFSLGAALYGILVKQWIREYLQWNSALALPRDNVMIRQLRFDAWNKWNVPATIMAIPALLEISVVLFLTGVVVLLWTLDDVVALVITVAISTILFVAGTTTVLPAFIGYCPYKSPTGWAFIKTWDTVTRLFLAPFGSRTFPGWRERELGVDCKRNEKVLDKYVPTYRQVRSTWVDGETQRMMARSALAQYTAKIVPLVRAIAWSRRAFQDESAEILMLDCLQLHQLPELKYYRELSFAGAWLHLLHIFAPIFHENPTRGNRYISLCREGYRVERLEGRPHSPSEYCIVVQDISDKLRGGPSFDLKLPSYQVFSHMTLSYLQAEWWTPSYNTMEDKLDMLFFSRLMVLPETSPSIISRYRGFLLRLYNTSKPCGTSLGGGATYFCLKTTALLLLCESAMVKLSDTGITVTTGTMESEHYAQLAVDLYTSSRVRPMDSNEKLHAFVMLADRALMSYECREDAWNGSFMSSAVQLTLLRLMTKAARNHSVRDCGCFVDLPWISTLLKSYWRVPLVSLAVFIDLIDALGEGLSYGCIAGDENRRLYRKLWVISHRNLLPPTDSSRSTSPSIDTAHTEDHSSRSPSVGTVPIARIVEHTDAMPIEGQATSPLPDSYSMNTIERCSEMASPSSPDIDAIGEDIHLDIISSQ